MKHMTDTDWRTKDEQYVWHAMSPYNPQNTMIVEQSDGVWLTDIDGNRYLDAMAGLWCVNVGYGREEIAKAAYDQLLKNSYTPLSIGHTPAIALSEKINELLGDDYVIFYSNSGSEANEVAFKIARQYHKQNGQAERTKIISRYRAYHGNTAGSLAATGQAQRKFKYEALAPGHIHVSPPDMYRYPETAARPTDLPSVQEVDRTMTWELSETIAAIIMEPIITGGGILFPHDDYLKGIREVCDKHGALLIVDEVINGFGRTGKPFGFQHYDVKPDIITMAKGLTSAYMPLSATAVKRNIYEAFMSSGEYDFFRHVNTFGGSPAACAVALKNIDIMEREQLFKKSEELGSILLAELTERLGNHSKVGDIRGKGLLIGIELVEDKSSKQPVDVSYTNAIIAHCKQHGLIIGKNGTTTAGFNNVLTLSPPLVLSVEEKNMIVEALVQAFDAHQ